MGDQTIFDFLHPPQEPPESHLREMKSLRRVLQDRINREVNKLDSAVRAADNEAAELLRTKTLLQLWAWRRVLPVQFPSDFRRTVFVRRVRIREPSGKAWLKARGFEAPRGRCFNRKLLAFVSRLFRNGEELPEEALELEFGSFVKRREYSERKKMFLNRKT